MASIFDLADQFGLASSPLGDWLPTGNVPIPGMAITLISAAYEGSSKRYIITFEIIAGGLRGKDATVALLPDSAEPAASSPTLAKQSVQLQDGRLTGTFAVPATKIADLPAEYYLLLLSGERAAASVYFPLGLPAMPRRVAAAPPAATRRAVTAAATSPSSDCPLCARALTMDELRRLAPHVAVASAQKHLEGFNQACADNAITTCLRKVHFLAQLLTESANFRYTHELDPKAVSKHAGFEGRGLIQLTKRVMYEAYGKFVKEDFTKSLAARQKLENPPHAARSAGWYWATHGLSPRADNNDFISITCRINGAFNGYSDRLANLTTAVRALNALGCTLTVDTNYQVQDSDVYDTPVYTFGWGLYHDPDLARNNRVRKGRPVPPDAPRDAAAALAGYRRTIELLEANKRRSAKMLNNLGIRTMAEFVSVRTAKGNVFALDAARLRVQELEKKQ